MPPRVKSDVAVQQVGDELLILSVRTEQIHQLNETAAWIVTQCNGSNSIQAISQAFAAHFSIDTKTAMEDVAGTVEQLHRAGIIELD
jgi:flagellar biogenesis protein FliO